MGAHQSLSEIEELIYKGQLEQASDSLEELKSVLKIKSEHRHLEHLQGKIFYFNSNYAQALTIYKNSIIKYGPHIGLLCDQVFCLIMLGRYSEIENTIHELKKQYYLCSEIISIDSRIRTLLFLSKVFFEWCYFAESIKFLEEAQSLIQAQPIWIDLTHVGLLRVKSFLNFKSQELNSLYSSVENIKFESPKHKIEKIHALLLSDIQISGLEKCLIRKGEFFNKTQFNRDQMIILSEVIEQSIYYKTVHNLPPSLINRFLLLNHRDGFERVLQIFLSTDINQLGNKWIQNCLDAIENDNSLGKLKTLFLLKMNLTDENYKFEITNRIIRIVSGLSEQNQKLIKQKWGSLDSANSVSKELVLEQDFISLSGQKVVQPKNGLFSYLVHQLKFKNLLTAEEIIRGFWNEELSIQALDRLKVAINRINQYFRKTFSIENIILYSKTEIKLDYRIKIQK